MHIEARSVMPDGSGAVDVGSAVAPTSSIESRTRLMESQRTAQSAERAPVLFIGHGSPLNILRDNAFTQRLAQLGRELPRPAAVCVVSAHWLTHGETSVSTSEAPETIHDFSGFPPELYAVRYPAPGAATQARQVIAGGKSVLLREDSQRGLDHGAWSVLLHMWPAADVPVFQLSMDWDKPQAWHLALGTELRALRRRGVLVLCSGNIVHNLSKISPEENDPHTPSWASEFDDWVAQRLAARDFAALVEHERHGPQARLAVPANDHYLPLVYAVGALEADEHVRTLHTGFQNASISMRCWVSDESSAGAE
jgi:4,5-DOPA dioxygenase extradiol